MREAREAGTYQTFTVTRTLEDPGKPGHLELLIRWTGQDGRTTGGLSGVDEGG